MKFNFNVNDTIITRIGQNKIPSKQAATDKAKFDFSNHWDGYRKTAIFYSDTTNNRILLLDEQNECYIPWENLINEGVLYIGVFGTQGDGKKTTNFVTLTIVDGSYVSEEVANPPTPDIYTQILDFVDQYNSNMTTITNDMIKHIGENDTKVVDIQNQVNNLSVVGDSSVEAAQARARYDGKNFTNLKERMDNEYDEVTSHLRHIEDEKANKDEIANGLIAKGNSLFSALPTNNQVGDYYYCSDGDGVNPAGNYVWNGTTWYFGGTGDQGYNNLKNDFNQVSELVIPTNIYNASKAVQGTLNTTGGVTESTYITTEMIAVNPNDILYAYYHINGVLKLNSMIFYVLSLYDANGKFKTRTGTLYTHTFTVPSDVYFIRATLQITYALYANASMITKNVKATKYSEYFTAYQTAKDINARDVAKKAYDLAKLADAVSPNTNIIDVWGDSRSEMIAMSGTAFADYLQTFLGSDYIVANYGISSQCANMTATRFGSNELYVTLENNQIPASGSVNITAFKSSVGDTAGGDFRENSLEVGVDCEINGVRGLLVRRYSSEQYFTRYTNGLAVSVKPRTKIFVPNSNSKNHLCIFWTGKNDMSFNNGTRIVGVLESIESMVKALGHDYYIVLGETYSTTENYLAGTPYRNTVDAINAVYALDYQNNYIDIQAELINQGLTLGGITATDADNTNIANGFIPASLMADTIHPNEYGREAIAKIIYEFMQKKEWI